LAGFCFHAAGVRPACSLPSTQVNIRAGRFPAAESNGVRYLKIPVKLVA
jgi:hypothetical protein